MTWNNTPPTEKAVAAASHDNDPPEAKSVAGLSFNNGSPAAKAVPGASFSNSSPWNKLVDNADFAVLEDASEFVVGQLTSGSLEIFDYATQTSQGSYTILSNTTINLTSYLITLTLDEVLDPDPAAPGDYYAILTTFDGRQYRCVIDDTDVTAIDLIIEAPLPAAKTVAGASFSNTPPVTKSV